MQTILEHKIKVLVNSVVQAATAVISSAPQSSSGMGQTLSKVGHSAHIYCVVSMLVTLCHIFFLCRM